MAKYFSYARDNLGARLITCHGWAFKIRSNGPRVEVQEGDEGEAILSLRMVTSLCKSGSMGTETNRERGESMRILNWLPGQSSKLTQDRGSEIGPLSSVGVKGVESSGKLRLLRRPFHPDVEILRRLAPKDISEAHLSKWNDMY